MALYLTLTSDGFVLVSYLTYPSNTWVLLEFFCHDELTQEFFYLWLLEHSTLLATCFSLNLKAYMWHGHVLFGGLFVVNSRNILLKYLFKLFLDSRKS